MIKGLKWKMESVKGEREKGEREKEKVVGFQLSVYSYRFSKLFYTSDNQIVQSFKCQIVHKSNSHFEKLSERIPDAPRPHALAV